MDQSGGGVGAVDGFLGEAFEGHAVDFAGGGEGHFVEEDDFVGGFVADFGAGETDEVLARGAFDAGGGGDVGTDVFAVDGVVDADDAGGGDSGVFEEDVLDFLMAGACAVQVGTAVFADPVLPLRLIDELHAWCAAEGLASHRELVGAALPRRRDRPSVKGVEYRP